jgi:peptidoglycan DL-endopeptidase CwlO
VRGRTAARSIRSVAIVLAGVAALLTAGGASADDPGSPRSQTERLEAQNAGLAAKERSAVLELYALGTRLARADRRVQALRNEAAELTRQREAAEQRLGIVRTSLATAEHALADRLRTLYVEGDPDPLAVLLGARSLAEALAALDSLGRFAEHDKEIVQRVQAARTRVKQALRELASEQARLRALTSEAEAARDGVAAAQAERAAYLTDLRQQQRLNAAQIDELIASATAAEAKTDEVMSSQPESSAGSSPSPAPTQGRKLTVLATGYSIHGTTATGVPTGWGVVAVDPSVIPLGTRMTVPGYGEGVAADTGGSVKGNKIDLWFPTREQALAWGQRTVTITLH